MADLRHREATLVTGQKKQDIFDWLPPDTVEHLAATVVADPNTPIEDIAARAGVSSQHANALARTARFSALVLEIASQRMAQRAVPRAVRILADVMAGEHIPAAVRLDAAKATLTHAKSYVEAFAGTRSDTVGLEDMTLQELRELVEAGEARLGEKAKDITPSSAQDSGKEDAMKYVD